jgi:hypothetical protein
MADVVILDAETHHDLRVVEGNGSQFGENIQFAPVLATELRQLVLEYPVLFMKNPETGKFGLVVVLGAKPDENRYLEADRWQSSYIPIHFRRAPFLAVQSASDGSGSGALAIDLEHVRISRDRGTRLFDDARQPGALLAEARRLVSLAMAGVRPTERMIELFVERGLVVPWRGTEIDPGSAASLLYAIDEQALAELEEADLGDLHRGGFLQAAFLVAASRGHLSRFAVPT